MWRKFNIMTLQELFREVNFDDLVPHILDWDGDRKSRLAEMKVAFDVIRGLYPTEPDDKTLEVVFDKDCPTKVSDLRICDGPRWNEDVWKTIKDYDRLTFDKNQLAAVGLCECSYNGDVKSNLDDFVHDLYSGVGYVKPVNEYWEKYIELDESRTDTSYDLSKMTLEEMLSDIRHPSEETKRFEARANGLRFSAKIEGHCQKLRRNKINGVTESDLWGILYKGCEDFLFLSVAKSPEESADYFIELLEKYDCRDYSNFSKVFITISGSAKARAGIEKLMPVLKTRFPNVTVGIGESPFDFLELRGILVK